MKRGVLFVAAMVLIPFGYGQEVRQRKHTNGPGEAFPYAFFCESSSPRGILLGLPEAGGKWDHESWCSELYPIAEKNEWLLLVPKRGQDLQTDVGRVERLLAVYRDSVTNINTRTIALGNADVLALAFVSKGIPALIISPGGKNLEWNGTPAETAVAISTNADNRMAAALSDTLARAGLWLRMAIHNEEADYYIHDHYQVYDNLLLWVDSMNLQLTDSTARSKLYARAGVTSAIPEVLKQGEPVPLDLWVVTPAVYTVQVFNLSAHPVHTLKRFMGRGKHTLALPTDSLDWGVYHIEVTGAGLRQRYKIMIRG